MGQAVSFFLCRLLFQTGRKMSSLQRILRVRPKTQVPICLEVAFGPKPQGSWSAFGCSDELPAVQLHPSKEEAQPLLPTPWSSLEPLDLQPLAGLPLAGLAGLKGPHLLPWPQ